MPVVTDDGGSTIISYNLLMDDGLNGDYVSIAGGNDLVLNMERFFTITNGIVKGRTYRFMYRV